MKASLPLAQINTQGQVTSPIWLLRQKGFDFGSVVSYPRADAVENEAVDPEANETDRCLYVIKSMDSVQGLVMLTLLGGDEQRSVQVEAFLAFAKVAKPGNLEVFHPKWPEGRILEQTAARRAFYAAQGQCAIGMLALSLTNRVSDQCDILLKPVKVVRAKKEVPAGGLALLPEGKVVYYPGDKKRCTRRWRSGA